MPLYGATCGQLYRHVGSGQAHTRCCHQGQPQGCPAAPKPPKPRDLQDIRGGLAHGSWRYSRLHLAPLLCLVVPARPLCPSKHA